LILPASVRIYSLQAQQKIKKQDPKYINGASVLSGTIE